MTERIITSISQWRHHEGITEPDHDRALARDGVGGDVQLPPDRGDRCHLRGAHDIRFIHILCLPSLERKAGEEVAQDRVALPDEILPRALRPAIRAEQDDGDDDEPTDEVPVPDEHVYVQYEPGRPFAVVVPDLAVHVKEHADALRDEEAEERQAVELVEAREHDVPVEEEVEDGDVQVQGGDLGRQGHHTRAEVRVLVPVRVPEGHEDRLDLELAVVDRLVQREVVHEALVHEARNHHVQQAVCPDEHKDIPGLIRRHLLSGTGDTEEDDGVRNVPIRPRGQQRRGVKPGHIRIGDLVAPGGAGHNGPEIPTPAHRIEQLGFLLVEKTLVRPVLCDLMYTSPVQSVR